MKKKYTAEEVKELILQQAALLFATKGYEKTSISDIVANLDGLTRGAVYHHFDSKFDILIEIANKLIPSDEKIQVLINKNISGLEKIQQLLLEGMFNEVVIKEMSHSLVLLKEPLFSAIYNQQICLRLGPVIETFIFEGTQDGSINVESSKEMSEIVILLTTTWFIESLFPDSGERLIQKLKTAQTILRKSGMDVLSDEVYMVIMNQLERIT